jgi:flavin-dependent dehydrogenase
MADQLKQNGGHLREHWRDFVAKLKRRGLVHYDDYDPKGYSYYLRDSVDAVSAGNACIIGDAAGLATRDMCEGIGPAVRSGLLAAHSIVTGEPYSLAGISTLSGSNFVSRLLERKFAGRDAAG